jgi:hypothetical protein
MQRMHVEAVKRGGIPSKRGLIHDRSRPVTCAECDASYYLYYDREAEMRSTLCSILAAEIITARHPNHKPSIVLELPVEITEASKKKLRGPFGRAG